MWLNLFLVSSASLLVGFLLGWVVGRPKRWGPVRPETPEPNNDTYAA